MLKSLVLLAGLSFVPALVLALLVGWLLPRASSRTIVLVAVLAVPTILLCLTIVILYALQGIKDDGGVGLVVALILCQIWIPIAAATGWLAGRLAIALLGRTQTDRASAAEKHM